MNSPLTNKTLENSQVATETSIENLWTTPEVARFLRISPKSVYNRRKKGMPYSQVGGAVRFEPQKIRDYVSNNCRVASHQSRQVRVKGAT